MIDDWVEGETEPRRYVLKAGGVPFNLTGLTVTLVLTDRAGVIVDTAGDVAIVTPQTGADIGAVIYSPDAADLMPSVGEVYHTTTVSPVVGDFAYFSRRARFKVVDGAATIGYFPRGDPDLWRIHKVQG
jgi:hypothetical protein